MCVCVCVYVWMEGCTYVCLSVCLSVRLSVWIYIKLYADFGDVLAEKCQHLTGCPEGTELCGIERNRTTGKPLTETYVDAQGVKQVHTSYPLAACSVPRIPRDLGALSFFHSTSVYLLPISLSCVGADQAQVPDPVRGRRRWRA